MWSYAAWQGRYLPQPLASRESLHAYATWCNAVEGNTTFYATPALDTVRSWAAQTEPDFRLVLKLPKAITHERRLADVADPLRSFLAAIEPLGPRAHALWIQLPPSFSPADLGALSGFLRRLPREYRYAVEVRHRAFFADPRWEQQLESVLGAVGAEWVPFDTTVLFGSPPVSDIEREAWRNKPRVPRRTRALTSHPIVRYIGRDDPARTAAGWQDWADVVAGWLREGRSPTVFIHTPDNVEALELARRFHDDVRTRMPEIEPLPEPVPAGPPTLFWPASVGAAAGGHARAMTMRTVGVEEELLLVEPGTGQPLAVAETALRAAGQPEETELAAELQRQQLETNTTVCRDLGELAREVRRCRSLAAEAAASAGARVAALGTSPAPVLPQLVREGRYLRMARAFGITAEEQLTCGCHVHVGISSADEAVAVLDRIRPWLAVLLALSANSPFWQGRDTSYASFRYQAWGRWPTAGPTEAFVTVEAYRQTVRQMVGTGTLLDSGMVYSTRGSPSTIRRWRYASPTCACTPMTRC